MRSHQLLWSVEAHGEIEVSGCQFDVSARLSDDASKEVKSRFDSYPKQQTDGADMHHFCVMCRKEIVEVLVIPR